MKPLPFRVAVVHPSIAKKERRAAGDLYPDRERKPAHGQVLVYQGVGGTGKTTVSVQLVRIYAGKGLSVCCLAFARRDREALEKRVHKRAKVFTSNGAGFGILTNFARRQGYRLDHNNHAAHDILEQKLVADHLVRVDAAGRRHFEIDYAAFTAILGLLGKVRTCLALKANDPKYASKPTDQDFQDLADRFGFEISTENWPLVLKYGHWLFGELADLRNLPVWGCDYDGQVFLPVYHDLKPAVQFDRVIVDELQDQSFVNRMIALLYTKPTGKLVGVGDENQAIYEWRGAAHDAMEQMRKLMGDPNVMDLTLCRRCSQAVIRDAQKLVPEIKALPEAPEGSSNAQEPISSDELFDRLCQERKGLVLCRMNAPGVSLCLRLLAKRIPAALARTNVIGDLLRLLDSLTNNTDRTPVTDVLRLLQ